MGPPLPSLSALSFCQRPPPSVLFCPATAHCAAQHCLTTNERPSVTLLTVEMADGQAQVSRAACPAGGGRGSSAMHNGRVSVIHRALHIPCSLRPLLHQQASSPCSARSSGALRQSAAQFPVGVVQQVE